MALLPAITFGRPGDLGAGNAISSRWDRVRCGGLFQSADPHPGQDVDTSSVSEMNLCPQRSHAISRAGIMVLVIIAIASPLLV